MNLYLNTFKYVIYCALTYIRRYKTLLGEYKQVCQIYYDRSSLLTHQQCKITMSIKRHQMACQRTNKRL